MSTFLTVKKQKKLVFIIQLLQYSLGREGIKSAELLSDHERGYRGICLVNNGRLIKGSKEKQCVMLYNSHPSTKYVSKGCVNRNTPKK